ncbi:MAG: biotin transporter BioY [Coriobacteriia bacterium]
MPRARTVSFLRAALVAALVSAGAVVTLPVGPVPVTLQVLAIAVAVLVLSPAEAFLALALYVALGSVGMPVFSGGGAGLGVLVGPTGGFLMGFVVGAPLASLARRMVAHLTGGTIRADVTALLVLLSVTYLAGWAHFAAVSGRSAAEAFGLAVAPFVLVDAAKGAAALLVARAVRAAGLGDRHRTAR